MTAMGISSTYDLAGLDWVLRGWHPWFWCNKISMETGIGLQSDVGPLLAKVPGSVQQSLCDAGMLPDWTVGLNSRQCEWVEHRHWSYEANLPDVWCNSNGRKMLRMEGLDGCGILFVNQRRVREFANAFIHYEVDITECLKESGNSICLLFTDQPQSLGQVGYTSKIKDFKPRFNYVWDWCPRMVQIGIWDTITLKVIPQAQLQIQSLYTTCNPQTREGKLHVRLAELPADSSVNIRIENPDQKTILNSVIAKGDFEVVCPQIDLWQPWELGRQSIYTVHLELLNSTGEVVDQQVRTVGFRDIQWQACEGAPADALPWICTINGTRLFLQGVNWTPIRMNFADVTEEEYRNRLQAYRAMGMNVLRVWGGAFLEKEIFYRLCDEMGMLIWQEFPLSSSGPENWPPEDPAVIAETQMIAQSYIVRRQHHPSLLQWCGGNELQGGIDGSKIGCGKPVDMTHPLMAMLGEQVATLDSARRFLPSSASGPRFMADEKDFGKGLHHDVHGPWDQTGTFEQWQAYWDKDDALFRSEVGVPASGPADLLRQYAGDHVLPATLENPYWRHVSTWWIQWEKYLAEAGDPNSVEQYVQWSQSRQAAALMYAINACRKRFPRCGGIILWMGHDCFPCPSNTSILDFKGRPKFTGEHLVIERSQQA